MDDRDHRRYVLVPRAGREAPAPGVQVRRFSLARVALSPRSELGYDRHERLERVAEAERPPEPPPAA